MQASLRCCLLLRNELTKYNSSKRSTNQLLSLFSSFTTSTQRDISTNNNNNNNRFTKMRISTLATNTALSYSAIASMSTLSSFVNRSFHVVHAFSPNSSINNNNNNIMVTSKKNKKLGHVLNLSSTAPIKLNDDEIRIKSNSNSDVNESYTNNKPTVVATALAKSFIPAPNGRCGVMAVKLREEDYIPLDISNQVPEAPMVEGDEALISQTGMFGGSGNKATSQMKKATEGMFMKRYYIIICFLLSDKQNIMTLM